MRKNIVFCAFIMLVTMAVLAAPRPQIKGEYLETRSADVYVGRCFANGETKTTGQEAIVAWHNSQGSWGRGLLRGRTVGGDDKAQGTPGVAYGSPHAGE